MFSSTLFYMFLGITTILLWISLSIKVYSVLLSLLGVYPMFIHCHTRSKCLCILFLLLTLSFFLVPSTPSLAEQFSPIYSITIKRILWQCSNFSPIFIVPFLSFTLFTPMKLENPIERLFTSVFTILYMLTTLQVF